MSPGKMIFAVLELWLSRLQWILNSQVFNIYRRYDANKKNYKSNIAEERRRVDRFFRLYLNAVLPR